MTYPNFKVHVLLSGSRKKSMELLTESFPSFEVIDTGDEISYTQSENLGLKKCRGDLVCFLDNDTKVTPGWLDELIKEFRDPQVAAAVPKMYDFHGRLSSAGGICDYFGFAYNRGIGEEDHGQYDVPCYIPYACTAAAVMRRSVVAEVGYWDEECIAYYGDVDLSLRLLLRGYKIRYNPKSVVYHEHGGTRKWMRRSAIIGLWERDRVRTLLRIYENKTLMTVLPTLCVLKSLHFIYAVVTIRDPSEVRSVLAAYIWNLVHLKDTLRLRRRIKLIRLTSDAEFAHLLFPKSLELSVGLGKTFHPIARRGKGGSDYMSSAK